LTHQTRAQTVALADGNALTSNGLTYTITSCSYALAGVSQSGCGPAGAELEAIGSGRGASIEIIDSNNGTPLLSIAGNAGDIYSDISLGLSITASSPTRTITSVTDTLSETGVSGHALQVSAAVESNSTSTAVNLLPNLTSLSDSASFAAYNPTVAAPLILNVDLNVSTLPGVGGNLGGIKLTYASIQAPEPASIALFGTALTGLAAVRRRLLKRPVRQAPAAS
jgi:hypothetical protein